ncbi:sensor histidine kinase [Uliginosibacterium sp. H1]|uniref:sensor histidine kinase n=1 Tax=Uliginosibacterium sp. H1 TaxID=3114757 RepID=UPI002E170193|nr:ATP-binding protein [Uliginosibacterium sp. H1]
MGRLFWKLFLAIFLTQVLTVWGVGVLIWIERSDKQSAALLPPPPGQPDRRPPGPTPEGPIADRPFSGPPGDGAAPRPGFSPGHGPGPRGVPWPPLVVGLVASLISAALLARHLSRPIVGLRKAFGAVAGGDFSTANPVGKPGRWRDELSDLAGDFDRTSAQLKMLIDNQRRLLHDVSHEIRSPLARMQLAIDLVRQQPERIPESMQRLERESARINRLVEELLTLSRLQAGGFGSLAERIELSELLHELVEDARFEFEARDCNLVLACAEHAQVEGRGELLLRAIDNVIRNALRYSPASGTVSISLRRVGPLACIRVEDEGPGVAESALDAIFDPFVRLNDSRSNDGYGLGLTITRQAIEAHGGSVRARNREQGGLCVEMRLPLRDPGG